MFLFTEIRSIAIPHEKILDRIFLIRGKKVMLDRDLAVLYGVQTKALNQAVRRNVKRFPEDFMFELNKQEISDLRNSESWSQFVTMKGKNIKYPPLAFTEQGVAMLSSVLNSEKAITVNIQIIRTYIKLMEALKDNLKIQEKIYALEKKYDLKIAEIFEILRLLTTEEEKPTEPIGFRIK